jgi:hypothetical protein
VTRWELLGEFKNGGSDYGPQGQPIEVNTHDFEDKKLGKVVPYGVPGSSPSMPFASGPNKGRADSIPRCSRRLVCHFPPGTSKWNKIEHRMFCHISQNWRAMPVASLLVVIELIANTTTKTGLKIRFHPEWNYSIAPRSSKMER